MKGETDFNRWPQWIGGGTAITLLVCYGLIASPVQDEAAEPLSAQIRPWEQESFWHSMTRSTSIDGWEAIQGFARKLIENSVQLDPKAARLISEHFWELV